MAHIAQNLLIGFSLRKSAEPGAKKSHILTLWMKMGKWATTPGPGWLLQADSVLFPQVTSTGCSKR